MTGKSIASETDVQHKASLFKLSVIILKSALFLMLTADRRNFSREAVLQVETMISTRSRKAVRISSVAMKIATLETDRKCCLTIKANSIS